MMFVNDLILLSKASEPSIRATIAAMHEFAQVSRLQINKEKSLIVIREVKQQVKQELIILCGFSKGKSFFQVSSLGCYNFQIKQEWLYSTC